METRIQTAIAQSKVVLFMKGSKNFPQCGFSAQVVSILRNKGVSFADVNILADAELRQGLKQFSNWPTFPQLYVDGKLIGGSDIVAGLDERGELNQVLGLD